MDRGEPIVVLGGGPAGVVAARGLAAAGFSVTIVASGRGGAAGGWLEGLSSRAVQALGAAGCRRAVDGLGAAARRSVVWNGRASAANEEVLVDREGLEAALLDDARECGVRVLAARAESAASDDERCRILVRERSGVARELDAACVVDARGRAAPAPPGARRGPETIALGAFWLTGRAAQRRTTLAPFERGWCWVAEPGDGRAWIQLATASGGGASGPALAKLHRATVGALPEIAEIVDVRSPPATVEARSATATLSAAAIGERILRVGDAAFAPDPLSGSGLFEAVASALAVVPVATTIVRIPERRALALRFHAERTEETFLRLARVGRDFHRSESRWSDAPFWRERAVWPDDAPADPPPGVGDGAVERRPIARDGTIVEEDVLVTPDHPRGVWRIDEVPLVPLLGRIGGRRDDQAIAREHAAAAGLAEGAVARAIGWLRRRGLPRGS